MTYALPSDFLLHYQDKALELSENPERLILAIASASSEIDIYLSKNYKLPITQSVPYLKWANVAIAAKLLDIYGESEKIRRDYEDVIRTLSDSNLSLKDDSGNVIDENDSTFGYIVPYGASVGNRSAIEVKF